MTGFKIDVSLDEKQVNLDKSGLFAGMAHGA
jgi:hypothetical protein